jgi:hypothetical protein
VVGEFLKVRLASRFVPVADEAGQALGVLASLHAIAPGGEPIGGEVLSRLTGVSETPVVLDRFIRCLHLLNYLQGPHVGGGLLPVSAALLARVSQDHGRVFRQIVDQLLLPPPARLCVAACLAWQQQRVVCQLQQSYARLETERCIWWCSPVRRCCRAICPPCVLFFPAEAVSCLWNMAFVGLHQGV